MAPRGLCKGLILLTFTLLCSLIKTSQANVQDPRYIGCYRAEHVEIKDWENFTEAVIGQMTIDLCAKECANHQYLLSGLMNGNKCWCSRSSVYGREACPGCCQKPCEGDQSLKCGGWHTLDIYEAVVDRRYLGCYKASREGKWSRKNETKNDRTIDNCIQWCGWSHYPVSGLQYQQDCHCGYEGYHQLGRCVSQQNCKCDSVCFGNKTKKCGGVSAMSLYRTECRDPGKWASNCDETCHCKDKVGCNKATGQCPGNKCDAGWHGPRCNQACEEGTYSYDCTKTCHCLGSCHPELGFCGKRCAPGWVNFPTCDTACKEGSFGFDCKQTCHCFNQSKCDISNGACLDGQCPPGYNNSDQTCQTKCGYGTYGLDCAFNCTCGHCNKVTGACYKDKLIGIISGVVGLVFLIAAILQVFVLHRKCKAKKEIQGGKNKIKEETKEGAIENTYEYIAGASIQYYSGSIYDQSKLGMDVDTVKETLKVVYGTTPAGDENAYDQYDYATNPVEDQVYHYCA